VDAPSQKTLSSSGPGVKHARDPLSGKHTRHGEDASLYLRIQRRAQEQADRHSFACVMSFQNTISVTVFSLLEISIPQKLLKKAPYLLDAAEAEGVPIFGERGRTRERGASVENAPEVLPEVLPGRQHEAPAPAEDAAERARAERLQAASARLAGLASKVDAPAFVADAARAVLEELRAVPPSADLFSELAALAERLSLAVYQAMPEEGRRAIDREVREALTKVSPYAEDDARRDFAAGQRRQLVAKRYRLPDLLLPPQPGELAPKPARPTSTTRYEPRLSPLPAPKEKPAAPRTLVQRAVDDLAVMLFRAGLDGSKFFPWSREAAITAAWLSGWRQELLRDFEGRALVRAEDRALRAGKSRRRQRPPSGAPPD